MAEMSDDEHLDLPELPELPDSSADRAARSLSWEPTRSMAALPAGRKLIFVLGAPGSGKRTQCQRLEEEFSAKHLRVADLLRKEVTNGTARGQRISGFVEQGKVIPWELSLELLSEHLAGCGEEQLCLLDCFPQNLDNLYEAEQRLGACALAFLFSHQGVSSDRTEIAERRKRTFAEQTVPVIHALEARGLLRRVGVAESKNWVPTRDEVFAQVCAALGLA